MVPSNNYERPGWDAYKANEAFKNYGSNGLLLYAAQLRLGFDDLDTFASNALTDQSNDKKLDLISVDQDAGQLVIAQGYETEKCLKEAPANKATDLNAAVGWLISGDLSKFPPSMVGAVIEAREALAEDKISSLKLWYVHNLPESSNVQNELEQAERTAKSVVKTHFPNANIDITAVEIGRKTLEDDYLRIQAPILVSDKITFEVPGGFEFSGEGWRAYSTAIPAIELRRLWKTYDTKLTTPNIRNYLGVRKTDNNINHGIRKTAIEAPGDFVIYNNGITILVNNFSYVIDGKKTLLSVEGIGIVNGGQTTGTIGQVPDSDAASLDEAMVMARFVCCSNDGVVSNIIRFNNTQNRVAPSDFRSTDATQNRLREEFAKIPGAEYRGGRRGGAGDAMVRNRELLPDSSVAQSLAAFHGDPDLAYNKTRVIWEDDTQYSRVFRSDISARHIIFTFSLLKAIERVKKQLSDIPERERTEAQRQYAKFFSQRGSAYLLLAAVAKSLEIILKRPIPDSFQLSFKKNVSPDEAIEKWLPVVETILPFTSQLAPAVEQSLKSKEKVNAAIAQFSAMVDAFSVMGPVQFVNLAKLVK